MAENTLQYFPIGDGLQGFQADNPNHELLNYKNEPIIVTPPQRLILEAHASRPFGYPIRLQELTGQNIPEIENVIHEIELLRPKLGKPEDGQYHINYFENAKRPSHWVPYISKENMPSLQEGFYGFTPLLHPEVKDAHGNVIYIATTYAFVLSALLIAQGEEIFYNDIIRHTSLYPEYPQTATQNVHWFLENFNRIISTNENLPRVVIANYGNKYSYRFSATQSQNTVFLSSTGNVFDQRSEPTGNGHSIAPGNNTIEAVPPVNEHHINQEVTTSKKNANGLPTNANRHLAVESIQNEYNNHVATSILEFLESNRNVVLTRENIIDILHEAGLIQGEAKDINRAILQSIEKINLCKEKNDYKLHVYQINDGLRFFYTERPFPKAYTLNPEEYNERKRIIGIKGSQWLEGYNGEFIRLNEYQIAILSFMVSNNSSEIPAKKILTGLLSGDYKGVTLDFISSEIGDLLTKLGDPVVGKSALIPVWSTVPGEDNVLKRIRITKNCNAKNIFDGITPYSTNLIDANGREIKLSKPEALLLSLLEQNQNEQIDSRTLDDLFIKYFPILHLVNQEVPQTINIWYNLAHKINSITPEQPRNLFRIVDGIHDKFLLTTDESFEQIIFKYQTPFSFKPERHQYIEMAPGNLQPISCEMQSVFSVFEALGESAFEQGVPYDEIIACIQSQLSARNISSHAGQPDTVLDLFMQKHNVSNNHMQFYRGRIFGGQIIKDTFFGEWIYYKPAKKKLQIGVDSIDTMVA